jgi:hypothetical protein
MIDFDFLIDRFLFHSFSNYFIPAFHILVLQCQYRKVVVVLAPYVLVIAVLYHNSASERVTFSRLLATNRSNSGFRDQNNPK